MLYRNLLLAGASLIAVSASAQAPYRAAAATVVTIGARDFAFDAPVRVPAGLVTLRMTNHGTAPHHAQLIKFAGKRTIKDFIAALKPNAPPPSWATELGGPNAVDPHGTSEVTVVLEPGNYGFICFVDVPDKVPHFVKGMSRDLVVTKSAKAVAKLPDGDNLVTLVDYGFKLQKPLVAGHQRLTVTTDAAQPHELTLIRLAPGKTMQDVMTWMEKMQGPPPGNLFGGVAALVKGKPVSVPLDLEAGNYILICFVPDSKDGKPHFMHGMVQEVTVK